MSNDSDSLSDPRLLKASVPVSQEPLQKRKAEAETTLETTTEQPIQKKQAREPEKKNSIQQEIERVKQELKSLGKGNIQKQTEVMTKGSTLDELKSKYVGNGKVTVGKKKANIDILSKLGTFKYNTR